jgi:hypothetical protein
MTSFISKVFVSFGVVVCLISTVGILKADLIEAEVSLGIFCKDDVFCSDQPITVCPGHLVLGHRCGFWSEPTPNDPNAKKCKCGK